MNNKQKAIKTHESAAKVRRLYSDTEKEFFTKLEESIRLLQPHFPGKFVTIVLPMENPWLWTDSSIVLVDFSDFELEVHLQIRKVGDSYLWEEGCNGTDNSLFRTSNGLVELAFHMLHLLMDLSRIHKDAVEADKEEDDRETGEINYQHAIEPTLAASTGHITKATRDILDDEENIHLLPLIVYDKPTYGWWIVVPDEWELDEERQEKVPSDLRTLMDVCRRHDCKWLMLDCDGPVLEGLPVYVW